jgi:hypothetical protein
VCATDHQRLEHLAEGLQCLVRRARRPLFVLVITLLTVVVALAYATPPEASIRGICNSGGADDPNLDVFLESEAILPTSLPPLRRADAGTRFAGDCRSACAARPLTTVRDRGPPPGGVT